MTVNGDREKRWALFEQKLRERGLATAAIPKVPRAGEPLAAAFAQERLLFLEQLTPGSAAYNDHYALSVRGRLDLSLFSRVLDQIASRHEALRTTFSFGPGGEALQTIHDNSTIPLAHETWCENDEPFDSWVLAKAVTEAKTAFDLTNGPLTRARLLTRDSDQHVLLFTIHHAVWDGWSSGVFAHELSRLYAALAAGKPVPLPALETQYADYAAWQRQRLTGDTLAQKVTFWKAELAGAPAAIDIPADRPRPRLQSFVGRTLHAKLGPQLSMTLDARARELGHTPFSVMFAVFGALLARYSGQRDLVIATPIANRARVELEALIGCFVNTLALRVDLAGEPTLRTLASQVSDRVLRAQPHQDLPFEKLVEVLGAPRDLSRSPLSQVMFVLQNTPRRVLEIEGLTLAPFDVDAGFAKLDLTLNVFATDEGYATAWEYNTDLFDESTIRRMLVHYEQLLQRVVEAPDAAIFAVDLLRPDERRLLLDDWNGAASSYPQQTLHELFERQARESPDAPAVVVGTERLTYTEIAARARSVASALCDRGVRPGDLVGVFLRRDAQLIPALLGVLMCGAAYVPLDPAYPQDRLALIIDDADAVVIVTTVELAAMVPAALRGRTLDVADVVALPHGAIAPSRGCANDRAYVIYTSGSTGKPKGVEIEHRNAVSFIAWAHGVFSREELRGVLAATSVCFDLSVFEIFGTLLAGGTVIVADNALSLPELPAKDEVTLINTVPSAAAELLRSGGIPDGVRTVNLAGEPLPEATVLQLYALPHIARVYNLYGPSETTTYSTFTLTTRESWPPTIGRPIVNTRVYVLDERLNPVPLGVRGELYLGGAGVARGYLNRADLTGSRFLPDPFSSVRGARIYKTGDLVRWLASGELEYLGRNDHQVKLRGFRIELGEVEVALRRQAAVAEAVASVREDRPGAKSLVAYIVPRQDATLVIEELRAALSQSLPEYMVPAKFVRLESLPLSPNGKVDRARLPAPPERDEAKAHVAARNEVEATLCQVWAEVLHLERVGVHDNFFELGGDSIAAMRMSALARRAGLTLAVSQIFQYPSLESLAERVTRDGQARDAAALPTDALGLSPIQQWFFERELAHPNHYNQSLLVELEPDADLDALQRAATWTVERHSALRLRFESGERGHAQRFGAQARVEFHRIELGERTPEARRLAIEASILQLEGSLDFELGPLGHVAVFDAAKGHAGALFFVLHHLVVDVVSWHVLMSDIKAAYAQLRAGRELRPNQSVGNYADYVEYLARHTASPAGVESAAEWSRRELEVPRIPRDFANGKNLTRSRDSVRVSLDVARTSAIGARARRAYKLGIEDVTLTALCLALRAWANTPKIVVDVERHGRELPGAALDLSDSVGWFTALFPLTFAADPGPRAALLGLKAAVHATPDPGLSFQTLRYGGDEAARTRLSQMAEREVVFNFLGNLTESVGAGAPFARLRASSASSNHHPDNSRSHVLEVTAAIKSGALELQITFSRNLHERSTLEPLLERFTTELDLLATHLEGAGVGAFSPVDFPLARLSQAELDARHDAWWTKVEDVYALTPAQHAILVDVLRDPRAGYYLPQLQVVVAALDPDVLTQSLLVVLERHTALRTGLVWEGLQEPVQVVYARVDCPIVHEDWRADDEPTRRNRLRELMDRDREQGFLLERAPLIRLFHARWTDGEDMLLWTIHHAVSDGWSLPLIIGEVMASYSALASGSRPKLPPAAPFRDYVAWLSQRSQADGEAYFREVLRGASAVDIGIAEDPTYRRVTESELELDGATGRALEQLAKSHSVTLSVVIQAAWAVVLAAYSARRDVIFGSVDSGRSEQIEGVAEIVGMFVTTLPLRVSVDAETPVASLLRDVQIASIGIRDHAYVALARVASSAGSAGLFQSICVIENYPSLAGGADARLRLREVASAETTRFPLTVTASTRELVALAVSASLADRGAGRELLEAWRHALEQLATGVIHSVGDIELPEASRRRGVRAYWGALLEGVAATRLFTDRPRAGARVSSAAPVAFEIAISEPLTAAATSLARNIETQPALVLLGAFVVLVARLAAQSELLVSVEVEPGRHVPVRADVGGDATFGALVAQLDQQARGGRSHYDSTLLARLADVGSVAFSLVEPNRSGSSHPPGLELGLALHATPGGARAVWSYEPRLFDEASIMRMSRQLCGLLAAVAAHPERCIREIPYSDAIGPVGDFAAALVPDQTVLELLRASSTRAPDAVAVLSDTQQLTYAELDALSSRAAANLLKYGVARGDLVAVQLQRSPLLVVVLLAIVKAGAAYVAIDAATPAERTRFMLEDCGAGVCVVDRQPAWRASCATFVEAASLAATTALPAELPAVNANDLAYVIYTSGSTGRPKGVMVEHGSLLNYMAFYQQATQIGPADRSLQFASSSFDVSVEEIFGALCFGATLVLRSEDITPGKLLAACASRRLTVVSLPTAYWNEVTRALAAGAELPSSVRLVVIGGERATRDVLTDWWRHVRRVDQELAPVRLLNMYGPTEATISATFAELTPLSAGDAEPPIGRPVYGAVALVVDAHGHPVPLGMPGELLLGGRCLARGYLNRPELTAEKFAPNPLVAGRVYHTGDLVRWRADEQLEYLGRIDQQIKIRGYRVELGEIESALRAQPGVSDVVVVLRDEASDNPRLVAYVVGTAAAAALRESLSGLPPYMAPVAYVFLDALPVTRSGKIDRRALPAPESQVGRVDHVAPRTATEAKLADIWQRVLGIDQLGVEQNFFELGGHSLLATQVVSRIQSELGLAVEVRDLFEAPSVELLAERLRDRSSSSPRSALLPRHQDTAPLSFGQARLWFLEQLEPGGAAYNMPLSLRVFGKLDAPRLHRALAGVVRRHAILRTVFVTDENGQPVQRIHERATLDVEQSAVPDGVDAEAWLQRELRAEAIRPFDLATGPLLRARLLSVTELDHALVFNMHHIVSDGWSISVLVREVAALYRAFTAGAPSPLLELPIQYADYALWQREHLSGPELDRQLKFWTAELAGAPFRLELPKKAGARGQSFAGASLVDTLRMADRIDALALELSATPFVVLLAAWAVLLSRVSGQSELVIGTPIANRHRVETEALIGLFVNTLPIRVDLRGGPTFAALVAQLRERVLRAQAHEDLPFEKLVDALHVERDRERSPIFQVMFAMQNTPALDFGLPGLELSPIDARSDAAKFDITFNAERTAEGYATSWEYRTDYFAAAFVERLARLFTRLLETFVSAPQEPCARTPLLSAAERQATVVDWNETARDYPSALVHELISEQAKRTPLGVAVSDGAETLSYRELEVAADKLARRLLARGVGIEARIAVAVGRSVRLVVALLAVQKAGAAYVPLDPSLPQNRMRDILVDAQVSLVLTELSLADRIPRDQCRSLLCIDDDSHETIAGSPSWPRASADNLAYVMFTSGSTGRPKGVEVTHGALCNLLWSMRSEPGISASDVVLAATSLSFDIAGLELYLPLISGASVYVASREIAIDGRRLAETLNAERVTFFQATPSTFKLLLGAGFRGSNALKLLVGGEQVSVDLAERLLPCCASLWNVYGPTETTIWSTCTRLTSGSIATGVTIGKPIANTQAYVLDADLAPVPIGVPGELYLGGVGLARGYASRPDLTAERFLPSPFGPGRLYRTGDVARHLENGALECLGRVDHQVKVRGYRIELGEIEAALRRHPRVDDVAALVQSDAGDQRIVAYVVSSPAVDGEALRGFLQSSLPDYMVPSQFVALERLPTTPNGKLDRKALPQARFGTQDNAVAPRDETERAVARIFAELLRVPSVGVFDNFFDLGGHSLLATELVFRLRQEVGVDLLVKTLFEAPTVAGLAEAVRAPRDERARLPQNVVLARKGEGVPWFCFPALAGTAAAFLPSIQPDSGASVYLLEATGLDGQPPLDSVEAIAGVFVQTIRQTVPTGPVRLLGWSFGAVTAFVTAQALSAEGRSIEELVLLDPALPGVDTAEVDEGDVAAAFIGDIAEATGKVSALVTLWQHASMRPHDQTAAELFRSSQDIGIFPASATLSDFQRRLSVYSASAAALRRFTPSVLPGTYPVRARILAARDGNGQQTSAWLRFLPQAAFTLIEATHYTILEHLRGLLR